MAGIFRTHIHNLKALVASRSVLRPLSCCLAGVPRTIPAESLRTAQRSADFGWGFNIKPWKTNRAWSKLSGQISDTQRSKKKQKMLFPREKRSSETPGILRNITASQCGREGGSMPRFFGKCRGILLQRRPRAVRFLLLPYILPLANNFVKNGAILI